MEYPPDRAEVIRAEKALRSWANVHAKRDEVIRAALAAGVSTHRIQRITGVARTTIARIQAGTATGKEAR